MKIISQLNLKKEIAFTLLIDLSFVIVALIILGMFTMSLNQKYPEIKDLTQEKIMGYYETNDMAGIEVTMNIIENIKTTVITYVISATLIILVLWIITRIFIYRIISETKLHIKQSLKIAVTSLVSITLLLALIFGLFKVLNILPFKIITMILLLFYLHARTTIMAQQSLNKSLKDSIKTVFQIKRFIKPYLIVLLMVVLTLVLLIVAANMPYLIDITLMTIVLLLFINWARNFMFLAIKQIKV